MNRRKSLSALLIITLTLLGSCGGGGGGSSSTTDPSKLFVSSLTSGGQNLAAVFADDGGNSILSVRSVPGSDNIKMMVIETGDGDYATVTLQNGIPTSVTDGTTTATFSNWQGNTVDVTITSGGETETITGVDYSEYLAAASVNASKGWSEFFSAGWTTLTVAFCPVGIALAGVSIGAGLPAALVGCSLAGTNLYLLLNGQPTLVESTVTYVTSSATCAEVATNGGTLSQQQSCASTAGDTARENTQWIIPSGQVETDDGGGGGGTTFAGSCTLPGETTCINYVGTDQTAEQVAASCEAAGGTYSTGACSTTNKLGECTIAAGQTGETVITFYSPPYNESTAIATCDQAGGTWSS